MVVPLAALLLVFVIEFQAAAPIADQMCRLGIHLCVLAIGATGALFIDPKLVGDFGVQWMAILSILAVLTTVGLATVAIRIHHSNISAIYKAAGSVFMGLLAIGIVSGIVMQA